MHFNFSVHDDGRLFLAIKCFRLNKICTFTSTYFSSWLLLRGLLSDKHEERLWETNFQPVGYRKSSNALKGHVRPFSSWKHNLKWTSQNAQRFCTRWNEMECAHVDPGCVYYRKKLFDLCFQVMVWYLWLFLDESPSPCWSLFISILHVIFF